MKRCPSVLLNRLFGAIVLLWMPIDLAYAVNFPGLPTPPAADELKRAFPESCPPTAEPPPWGGLVKCEGDLEAYRKGVLEVYNTKIERYVGALKKADATLEVWKKSQRISSTDYETVHSQIADAFDSANVKTGSLFDPYNEYFARYREAADGVSLGFRRYYKDRLQTK